MFNQTSQFRGWLATLLGAFLLFTAQGSLAQEQTGRQILDESHKRHTQNYEVESQKMTIYANDAVTETLKKALSTTTLASKPS